MEWLYIFFFIWKALGLSDEGICRSPFLSFIFLAGIHVSNELHHKRMISEFPFTGNFWHIRTMEDVATALGTKIKTHEKVVESDSRKKPSEKESPNQR